MQKYFVGLLAVVVAISAVAFTTPANKKFVDRYFQFVGAAGTEATLANWQYIGTTNTLTCSDDAEKSCVIKVDPNVVSASGSTFVISASLLNTQYGTTTLPVSNSGIGLNKIPNETAKPGLYQDVINDLVP